MHGQKKKTSSYPIVLRIKHKNLKQKLLKMQCKRFYTQRNWILSEVINMTCIYYLNLSKPSDYVMHQQV